MSRRHNQPTPQWQQNLGTFTKITLGIIFVGAVGWNTFGSKEAQPPKPEGNTDKATEERNAQKPEKTVCTLPENNNGNTLEKTRYQQLQKTMTVTHNQDGSLKIKIPESVSANNNVKSAIVMLDGTYVTKTSSDTSPLELGVTTQGGKSVWNGMKSVKGDFPPPNQVTIALLSGSVKDFNTTTILEYQLQCAQR